MAQQYGSPMMKGDRVLYNKYVYDSLAHTCCSAIFALQKHFIYVHSNEDQHIHISCVRMQLLAQEKIFSGQNVSVIIVTSSKMSSVQIPSYKVMYTYLQLWEIAV